MGELEKLGHQLAGTSLGLVALGLAVAVVVWHRGSRRSWAAFAAAWGVWLLLDGYREGPTLLRVTERHGVTSADLLPALVAVPLAGALLWRRSVARACADRPR